MYFRKFYSQNLSQTIFTFKSVLWPKEYTVKTLSSTKHAFNLTKEALLCQPRSNSVTASIQFCKRAFHTSCPLRALPPVVYWKIILGLLKWTASFTGGGLKIWWSCLSNREKQYYLREFKRRQVQVVGVSALAGGAFYAYYTSHLVEDPITGRKKLVMFSEKEIIEVANDLCSDLIKQYGQQIVTSGKDHEKVLNVVRRIVKANSDLPGIKKKWRVIVIDEEQPNAFALPSGDIFIFAGYLKLVSNDDQLAVIIGHEMAHVLLGHCAEIESKSHIVELSKVLPIFFIWALLPPVIAIASHICLEYITPIMFYLPFIRSKEAEADIVGLEIMARACFDPREASTFWRRMNEVVAKTPTEWLSTHPNNDTRQQALNEHVPKAIRIFRRHCNGSDLDPRSPRNV